MNIFLSAQQMNIGMRMLMLSSVLALAACGGDTALRDDFSADDATAYEETPAAPLGNEQVINAPTDEAAVAVLWQQAEQKRKAGDFQAALVELEQAIQISPSSPVIYSRMAELRLELGEYVTAENLAAKSNQLAAGRNNLIAYRNWLIISKARQLNGDAAGAAKAQQRALSYQ